MDFKCWGCGACCRIKDGIVRVGDAEVKRIANPDSAEVCPALAKSVKQEKEI